MGQAREPARGGAQHRLGPPQFLYHRRLPGWGVPRKADRALADACFFCSDVAFRAVPRYGSLVVNWLTCLPAGRLVDWLIRLYSAMFS